MTKRVVLIGHPVSHSLSGAMQQAAFDKLGIDAQYELWDRPPASLAWLFSLACLLAPRLEARTPK